MLNISFWMRTKVWCMNTEYVYVYLFFEYYGGRLENKIPKKCWISSKRSIQFVKLTFLTKI